MKFRIALLLLAALLLVSCHKPADISDSLGIGRHTVMEEKNDSIDVNFEASYTRTDGYIEKKTYPHVTVINSRAELEKYTADYEGQYNFYHTADSKGFYDVVTPYDAVFFADNSLIMILLEEGSGSVRHEVSGIQYKDGETTIEISRIVPMGDATDDMAEWHVVIEIEKTSPVLENPDGIKVKFVNSNN